MLSNMNKSASPHIQFTLLTALLGVQHTLSPLAIPYLSIPASAAIQESRDTPKCGWGKGWAAGRGLDCKHGPRVDFGSGTVSY